MTLATRISLVVLAVVAALCAYLLWHIDWIEREVDTGFSDAAALQPYLAASLLVERAGSEAELRQGFSLLDSLVAADSPVADNDTIVLLEAHNELDVRQAAALSQWMNTGGTVIFATQNRLQSSTNPGNDILLQFFGIGLEARPDLEGEEAEASARAAMERVMTEYTEGRQELLCEVWRELTEFESGAMLNFAGNRTLYADIPDYSYYGDSRGTQVIVAPRGAGRLLAVTDGRIWDNHHLACWDHAWLLLQYRGSGKVWFLENRNAQSLLSRIWQLSAVGCVLLLLALALQLQRGSRRFGPLLATPPLARRSFLEHIEAGAQLLWDRREGAQLIELLRKDIHNRMQHLDRRFGDLDPTARHELIAHTTRLPFDSIALALGQPPPRRLTRDALRDLVAELQKIRSLM